ncbi:hypothetical protein H2248_002098 [Termitomyces sp. 'cryptogamus']|nr:hypothetical protein H2248_002084 [Termitomyces sp. 'cryptogamus']KAH0580609.1 hypothetical protein H2248_002098 [Termitomyces sp. 'cryptogamus']
MEAEQMNSSENGVQEKSERDDQEPSRAVFSLVTGTYRQAKRYGTEVSLALIRQIPRQHGG